MPLPNDEKLIALSEEILKQFEAMLGRIPDSGRAMPRAFY